MKFSADSIELGHADRWFAGGLGASIGYEELLDLAVSMERCLPEEIDKECDRLNELADNGIGFRNALDLLAEQRNEAESTYLARRMLLFSQLLLLDPSVEQCLRR